MSWEHIVVLLLTLYLVENGMKTKITPLHLQFCQKHLFVIIAVLRCASCTQTIKELYSVPSLSDSENLETKMEFLLPFWCHSLVPESLIQVMGAIWGGIRLKPFTVALSHSDKANFHPCTVTVTECRSRTLTVHLVHILFTLHTVVEAVPQRRTSFSLNFVAPRYSCCTCGVEVAPV